MGKIIELTPDIYNRIAAGEVIENPASVVKELIENAVDAQSTVIKVTIKEAGKKEISVIDNGIGMLQGELYLCIKKHTTSKITSIDDLNNIQTFGFRGEALSSIVSVANVELISRTEESNVGTRLQIEGAQDKIKESQTAMNKGTSIRVSNLFYNIPARLKFLKKDSTELLNIKNTLNKLIIPNYTVEFEIVIDNQKPVIYKKRTNLLDRIKDLYGDELTNGLVPIEQQTESLKISGFTSKPFYNKPNRTYQFLFLNKRPIVTKYFNYWLSTAYEGQLMHDRYPITFVFLEADNDFFDVNVHPAKKEVRFINENFVGHAIIHAVKTSLSDNKVIPEISKDINLTAQSSQVINNMKQQINRGINNYLSYHSEAAKYNIYQQPSNNINQRQMDITYQTVVNYYSLFDTYIFYEDKMNEEVLIIDQHAAHERIIYEKLKKKLQDKEEMTENLLIPINLHLSNVEFQTVMDNLKIFNECGYSIEDFGNNSILLNSIPKQVKHQNDKQFFMDILADLIDQKELNKINIKEELLKSMACKAAIKAGDKLNKEAKEVLINDLLALGDKYTCPHGRPSIIKLKKSEIEKWFKRK